MPETVRDLRRGQIVAAARRIVAADGLEALTIGTLEDALSFTRGVITYHFRGKDDVVDAVLQSAVAEVDRGMLRQVAAESAPADKARAVLHGMVHGFLSQPEAARVLLAFLGRAGADAHARRVTAALYARYRAQAAVLLQAGVRSGAFVQDVDVPASAANMVGAVIGIVTQALLDAGALDVDACVEEASRALSARLTPRRRGRSTGKAPAARPRPR